jgi:hypothetical protein
MAPEAPSSDSTSSGLALVRLALVTFAPAPPSWRQWGMQAGEIKIAPISIWPEEDGLKILLAATYPLKHLPKVTKENLVVLPQRQRTAAEEAIEIAANLIAVAQGCRRQIASPTPCVVLVATDQTGGSWLADRDGVLEGSPIATMSTDEQIDLDEAALNALADRLDGVALLVEALAHDHAMGKFRDLMRLFERAFALAPRRLAAPVTSFLDTRFGYTKEEVAVWFEKFRDPATHADSRNDFLLETDVRPVVGRMEQAAVDVLFNKRDWRDASTARRELWQPNTGTTDDKGNVFLTKGAAARLQAQLLDEHGAFPLDLTGIISRPPAEWWPPREAQSLTSGQGVIEIVDPEAGPAPAQAPAESASTKSR